MVILKALITGASGFVGSAMTRALQDNRIEVLGISRSRSTINGLETDQYHCDIMDKSKLRAILNSYRPDYIIHLAGPAFIPNSFNAPEKTYDVIFRGTLNLLEAVRELNFSTRMLYVSSADVYGAGRGDALSELSPLEPVNPYATAKACAELLCKQFYYSYGTDVVIARPFNHTGPGQSNDFVCSSFAYQIAQMLECDEKRLVTGNVDVERDFLDVRDVVEAYYGLLKAGKPGEVYNVCSNNAISIREIVRMLFETAGIKEYQIYVDGNKLRENDVKLRIGDNTKISKAISWSSKYRLEQTLSDLFEYWRGRLNVEV